MNSTATRKRRRAEWRSTGRLAGQGLGSAIDMVRDTHFAITTRVEQFLPETAAPVMITERAISSLVYGLVGAAHRTLPRAITAGVDVALPATAPPPSQTGKGAAAAAAANALWGDRFTRDHEAVAVRMAVRRAGRDIPLDTESLCAAFPRATENLVLFVHGLGEDDRVWRLSHEGDPTTYGQRLASEYGVTELRLRYNTGLHISQNGAELGRLVESLLANWPVPVRSVAIVGHSMGGLVARSAAAGGGRWTDSLRAIVSLGAPHSGALLEQAVHVLDCALRKLPETEPFSRPFVARSSGIKDLRYGAIMDDDWQGYDPDEFLRNRCTTVPPLAHVTYYWVAATITRNPGHPFGVLVGDGLVRRGSASGSHHRIGFTIENGVHLPGVGHLRLLNHPAVYQQLRTWLAPQPQAA